MPNNLIKSHNIKQIKINKSVSVLKATYVNSERVTMQVKIWDKTILPVYENSSGNGWDTSPQETKMATSLVPPQGRACPEWKPANHISYSIDMKRRASHDDVRAQGGSCESERRDGLGHGLVPAQLRSSKVNICTLKGTQEHTECQCRC